jgi:hypothetical protein
MILPLRVSSSSGREQDLARLGDRRPKWGSTVHSLASERQSIALSRIKDVDEALSKVRRAGLG